MRNKQFLPLIAAISAGHVSNILSLVTEFRLIKSVLAAMLLLCSVTMSQAAPFAEWIDYQVPGGAVVSIWGEVDEYSASFEAKDGHAIIWNTEALRYEYAVSDESAALVGSGIFPGDEIGKEAELAAIPLHLRDTSDAYAKARQKRVEERDAAKENNALREEYQKKLARTPISLLMST